MKFVRGRSRLSALAFSVVLGGAGFGVSLGYTGSASALAVPTVSTPSLPVPTPTVPVPTPTLPVPAPTVPAPVPTVPVPAPTPTVPVPVPAPALPVPTPTVPAPAPSPGTSVPVVPSAPLAGTPLPAGTSGGAPAGSVVVLGSSGPSTTSQTGAASTAAAPIERSRSTTTGVRVANERGRKAVKITFVVPRRSRVVVTLRGPLPYCARVARFVIQARRGQNTFRFDGRAGGRRLADGAYLLGMRPVPSARTRWGALQIGSSGVRALPRASADSALDRCSTASAATAAGPFAIGFLPEDGSGALLAAGETADREGDLNATVKPVEQPPRAGVLGAERISDAADVLLNPVFGIAILAVMIGSLLAIAYLVVSYVRGEGIGRPRI